jgi:hypothetical protein
VRKCGECQIVVVLSPCAEGWLERPLGGPGVGGDGDSQKPGAHDRSDPSCLMHGKGVFTQSTLRDHDHVAALEHNVLLEVLALLRVAVAEGEDLLLALFAAHDLDVVFRSERG